MWYVYILKSSRVKWYYVGSTDNIDRRLSEHQKGKVRSTKGFLPLNLIHTITVTSRQEARAFEQRLKKRRIEKEELIRNIESK